MVAPCLRGRQARPIKLFTCRYRSLAPAVRGGGRGELSGSEGKRRDGWSRSRWVSSRTIPHGRIRRLMARE
jgi:hypothetical protein